MRGKRSKQYRKLVKNFELTFGFREPYQVLVDAQMIQDTERFKMDLVGSLERTLHGKVKPMITQCSIRHLYAIPSIPPPQKDALVATARSMERRRCDHHTLDEPLSTLECLASVIDPKDSKTNKNRYVVASQEENVRRYCRGVKGVPLVYVKRSVMVMEPMADSSVGVREGIEREKFRTGLRAKGPGIGGKRKREDANYAETGISQDPRDMNNSDGLNEEQAPKKRRIRGPKGPNPLSVKKARKVKEHEERKDKDERPSENSLAQITERRLEEFQSETEERETKPVAVDITEGALDKKQNPPARRKRKRRHQMASFRDLRDK